MIRIELSDWAQAGADATRIREIVFVAEQGVPAEIECTGTGKFGHRMHDYGFRLSVQEAARCFDTHEIIDYC